MKTNEHPGIYVAAISPLTPLPAEPLGQIIFRVNMRITVFEQNMYLDIEVLVHGFDEAAQMAYSMLGRFFADGAEIAKKTSDALLGKLSKAG